MLQVDELSYGVGFYLGEEVRVGLVTDGIEPNLDLLIEGFADGVRKLMPDIDPDRLDAVMFAVHEEMQARMAKRRLAEDPDFKALHDRNLEQSRAFHEKFGAEPGVTTLPDGIQYRVLKPGQGPSPQPSDIVHVRFRVMHVDGTEFHASDGKDVRVDSVIRGASLLLQRMPVGSTWFVAVPPELAYGAAGDPPVIGPAETLLAEIELLEIK